ncbi:MAG: M23 family metallopeptidase [Muribaculaceae bacterium]|nr:M23 family metallopeptidase [Muribaculaceae bacterium]MDE6522724.1 M23 family metallopeptidase [Muribaculaceae bacterium]
MKHVFYRYNPDTDNFERHYPTLKTRLASLGRYFAVGSVIGIGLYTLLYYVFDTPTEQNLKEENNKLKSQYAILEKRLDNSIKVMEDIRNRDDNFYRVMMQMDPLSSKERYSGIENDSRLDELGHLNDAELVSRMNRSMDLLEHQIYSQSVSFDQLKAAAGEQKEKIACIPSVMPINVKDYTMSSGYGYRRDPVYGTAKFHEGLDFAAATGTPVFATADAVVEVADRKDAYGNCIDLNHGFNYLTRYAHLSQILVKPGQRVKRGEMIGKVGSTGKSTGSHLHYEVRFKGEPQNPVHYYFMDLTPQQYLDMIQLAENSGHVMD